MDRYQIRIVQNFDELFKLVINLNKHIMCYQDDTYAEFVVIIDEFACLYMVKYDEDNEINEINVNEVLPVKKRKLRTIKYSKH